MKLRGVSDDKKARPGRGSVMSEALVPTYSSQSSGLAQVNFTAAVSISIRCNQVRVGAE